MLLKLNDEIVLHNGTKGILCDFNHPGITLYLDFGYDDFHTKNIKSVNGNIVDDNETYTYKSDKVSLEEKTLNVLGMNDESDKLLLPEHYTHIHQPFYKGDGQLNVSELQKLCNDFTEYCHQQNIIKQKLIQEIKK